MNEEKLQINFIKWFALEHRKLWDERKLFAIPNGGARNPIVGAKLKAGGVRAGVWDLFLAVPKNGKCGLFLETKYGKNKLSAEQKEFMESLKDHFDFAIYYDIEGGIEAVNNYLK